MQTSGRSVAGLFALGTFGWCGFLRGLFGGLGFCRHRRARRLLCGGRRGFASRGSGFLSSGGWLFDGGCLFAGVCRFSGGRLRGCGLGGDRFGRSFGRNRLCGRWLRLRAPGDRRLPGGCGFCGGDFGGSCFDRRGFGGRGFRRRPGGLAGVLDPLDGGFGRRLCGSFDCGSGRGRDS